MFSRLVLLLPGSINYQKLARLLRPSDYIIAVDGGIEHSTQLGIKPHLWIGDFDSSQKDSKQRFSDIPIEEFPTDKDAVDTELALKKAKALNINQCIMIGGIGGRLDHQMGLFMLIMSHPELHITHTDGDTYLYSLNNQISRKIIAEAFKYVSIIPITQLDNVSIHGVKWPLNQVILPPGKGFSISNEPLEQTIEYSQSSGLGWLILTN